MLFFVTFLLSLFLLLLLLPNSHPPQRVCYHEKTREKETRVDSLQSGYHM